MIRLVTGSLGLLGEVEVGSSFAVSVAVGSVLGASLVVGFVVAGVLSGASLGSSAAAKRSGIGDAFTPSLSTGADRTR